MKRRVAQIVQRQILKPRRATGAPERRAERVRFNRDALALGAAPIMADFISEHARAVPAVFTAQDRHGRVRQRTAIDRSALAAHSDEAGVEIHVHPLQPARFGAAIPVTIRNRATG